MSDVASATVDHDSKTYLGFWIYLMTDCVLFASLFATYAVLHANTNGGEGAAGLFDLNFVLLETMILLTSSFFAGMALLSARRKDAGRALLLYGLVFILGAAFLALEVSEFRHLALEGNSWRQSAFLSSFFTLVGTHGAHITVGLLWLATLAIRVMKRGLGNNTLRQLTLFGMFWHFLDVVWIFIFTIVYLFGVIGV
ncbi:cytochrome o ubiquinol oxidase subunit III [Candidatus Saccharibacteria bacterium]|nr:cytochrome o ubiquinol oxidase subunit III [Candidatus Saccharibacteria bacterium]